MLVIEIDLTLWSSSMSRWTVVNGTLVGFPSARVRAFLAAAADGAEVGIRRWWDCWMAFAEPGQEDS
jgi:hypothetical protein